MVDAGILIVFLVINLVVGIRYSHGAKDLRDYAVGNKDFTTATLTATIVASWIGGSDVFYILQYTYVDGLYFVIVILGSSICLLLVSQLTPRMGRFLSSISVAEAMGDLYGTRVRIITAVSGVLSAVGVVAIEFQVIGEIITLLLGFSGKWVTVLAAAIVILYSVFGGIRAVTFTDVLQFFVFGTFIPLIALVIWHNLKDPHQVVSMLSTNPNFSLGEVIGLHPKFLKALAMLGWFAIPALDPVVFQRISMSRNVLQAKASFQYAGMISMLANLFMIWVAILLLSADRALDPTKLFTHVIGNYATTGLRGCICVGVVALAMSTADSYLNAGAVLLANDIVKPLRVMIRHEMFLAKIFCLVCGVLALLLALHAKGLLEILLFSNSFYMPVVTVPLLLAILGFQSSARSILIGMSMGFVTVVLWSIAFENADSILPGMMVSFLGLMGSHYLLGEEGGWQELPSGSPISIASIVRKHPWQRYLQAARSFRLYPYLQQNLPVQESFYFFCGLYAIVATYATFYTIDNIERQSYNVMYERVSYAVLLAATAFMTFPIWPSTIKSRRFMAFFWPLGIAGIFFFVGTLLVIMSDFHHIQIMIMMVNLLITILLLRWPLALFLALASASLAVYFFKYNTGIVVTIDALGSLQFRIIYGLLLFTSFLIVLFKSKQTYRQLERRSQHLSKANAQLMADEQEDKIALLEVFKEKVRIIKALGNAGVTDLSRIVALTTDLQYQTQTIFSTDHPCAIIIKQIKEAVSPIAVQLERIESRALEFLRLKPTEISINRLITMIQKECIGNELIIRKNVKDKFLTCDAKLVCKMITNCVRMIRREDTHSNVTKQVYLTLTDTQLNYPLGNIRRDYVKKVPAISFLIDQQSDFSPVEPMYTSQVNNLPSLPENYIDLILLTNQRIARAHYGYTNVASKHSRAPYMYVIPVDISEVRPKDTDLSYMELDAELVRADDSSSEAQQQEQELLDSLQSFTHIDLGKVRTAIEMIKWYHGPVKRYSGEPFYLHPLAVAKIVLEYNQDEATLLGALLHDTVEDTYMLLDNIETMFGIEVAQIVDAVTHLESNRKTFYKVRLSDNENILKLLGVKDLRALYVKIADKVHNMRTLHAKPADKQLDTAQETLRFFVPLAENLGLTKAVQELKEKALTVLG
jgi:Na+/proline symporter